MAEILDLSALRKAIASMESALEITNQPWFEQQSAPVRQALIAGVIQNFEFVYEICVKMIRRRLDYDSYFADTSGFVDYRDLLRGAAANGWVGEVEPWFQFRTMRNLTSHTYNQDKAQFVYEGSAALLSAAKDLLHRLEARNA